MKVNWVVTDSKGPFSLVSTFYEDRSVENMTAIRDMTGEDLAKKLYPSFNMATHAARLIAETDASRGFLVRALQIFEVCTD